MKVFCAVSSKQCCFLCTSIMKIFIILLSMYSLLYAEKSASVSIGVGYSMVQNEYQKLNTPYINNGVNTNLELNFMLAKYFGFVGGVNYAVNGFNSSQLATDYENKFFDDMDVSSDSYYKQLQYFIGITSKTKYFFNRVALQLSLSINQYKLYTPDYTISSEEYGKILKIKNVKTDAGRYIAFNPKFLVKLNKQIDLFLFYQNMDVSTSYSDSILYYGDVFGLGITFKFWEIK